MRKLFLSAHRMRASVSAITFCACGVATPALAVDCFDALLQPDSHEMCNLGLLGLEGFSGISYAMLVSADGSAISGFSSDVDFPNAHFYWSTGDAGLTPVPSLPGSFGNSAIIKAISGDGTTLVGYSDEGTNNIPIFWRKNLGTINLGTLRNDDSGWGEARGVSYDGSVIVGAASSDTGFRAFRWTSSGGMQDLGTLTETLVGDSFANGVSGDGSTVVGYASSDEGFYSAFLWRDDGKGLVDLGDLDTNPGWRPKALAASFDGTAIAGELWSSSGATIQRVFYWREGDVGLTDIGALRSDNQGFATMTALSDDGTTIVGMATTDAGTFAAFRWRNDGSGMINLGNIGAADRPYARAYAVSADGNAVVGEATDINNWRRAYIWRDDGNGMQDLGTLRPDQTGISAAYDISADGTTVVGRAQFDETSEYRAFIWRTKMQDLENVILSFPVQAADTEIALADQEHLVGSLLGQRCEASAGARCAATSGRVVARGGAVDQGFGEGRAVAVQQSFGYGLDGQTGFGGSVLFGENNADNSLVDPASARGAGLWATRSVGEGEGVLAISAAFGASPAEFFRGDKLTNVMVGEGEADITTNALRISFGQPVASIGGWSLRSEARLDYVQSVRSAYSETGSDFNANYDEARMERTTLGLDIEGSMLLSGGDRLRLGLGVETDLAVSGFGISGTTDLQGMESFDVQSPLQRRGTRGSLSLGYDHAVADGKWLSLDLGASQSSYGDALTLGGGVQFRIEF